jgi:hypothetical protein
MIIAGCAGTPGEGYLIMDVQQHTEDGTTYTVGQRVQRVDWENDGTPAYQGTLERIELDAGEAYYWIRWDGTPAADHHGPYAFRII